MKLSKPKRPTRPRMPAMPHRPYQGSMASSGRTPFCYPTNAMNAAFKKLKQKSISISKDGMVFTIDVNGVTVKNEDSQKKSAAAFLAKNDKYKKAKARYLVKKKACADKMEVYKKALKIYALDLAAWEKDKADANYKKLKEDLYK